MVRSIPDSEGSEPYRLAASPSHLLHRAEQLAAARFAHLVGDTIKLREFIILAAIAERPGLSQSDLGRITGIDRSTLADTMAKLEVRGWVSRALSTSDARAYSLLLSLEGEAMLAATTRHARAADAAILDLLPRTKARSLVNILNKLSKLADEAAAKAEREQRKLAKRQARDQTKLRKKKKQRG